MHVGLGIRKSLTFLSPTSGEVYSARYSSCKFGKKDKKIHIYYPKKGDTYMENKDQGDEIQI